MEALIKGMIMGMVMLTNIAGHWFPWRIWLSLVDEAGKLKRPFAYGYGCGSILAGLALWAAIYAELVNPPMVQIWEAWSMVVLLIVAAGMGAMLPRAVEWFLDRRHDHDDVTDYEQAITERQRPT